MNTKTRKLTVTAVFAALIYAVTYFSRIPVPVIGIVHFGDGIIFAACAALGWWAVPAAVIGSCLADLTMGAFYYIPATLVIKSVMAALFILFLKLAGPKSKPIAKRLPVIISGMLFAGLFMLFAYTGYEVLLIFFGMLDDEVILLFGLIRLLWSAVQPLAAIFIGTALIIGIEKVKILDFSAPRVIEEIETNEDSGVG